jgi:predicted O-methyltransferase YrrM
VSAWLSHPETFLRLEELGARYPPYQPTFPFAGHFIDASHRFYAECPLDPTGVLIQVRRRRWFGPPIQGWLRRADALKLYEMAYFADGDILELGSFNGLSTTILARARRASKRGVRLVSVDLNPGAIRETRRTLRLQGLDGDTEQVCGDAADVAARLVAGGRRFAFVFVDHSHEFDPTLRVCQALPSLLTPGGFCLFHDFNDARNADPDATDYEVYQAVMEGLDAQRFTFYGIYGCCALYRESSAASGSESDGRLVASRSITTVARRNSSAVSGQQSAVGKSSANSPDS